MATLSRTPTGLISELQHLLGDRYRLDKGALAVLKEIVQNADDAGATTLEFVVLDTGLPGADNSLLHGPALVCINDGAFTREHERAIRTMADTSKAEDAAAVGRFGVGQKSVFHLAEAYVYLGRAPGEADLLADVIDPWADPVRGDRTFPDWNDLKPGDRDLLRGALARWTTGDAWFALYLPLRRESHRRPRGGVIASYFPDPDGLAADLAKMLELACLLPQLRGLRSIRAWRGSESREPLAECRGPGLEGSIARTWAGPVQQRPFRGAIEVKHARTGATQLFCYGWERIADHRRLGRLRESKYWPQRKVGRDDDIDDVAEKALSHGAVTVIREPVTGGDGDLLLNWAVFLPLSYEAGERQRIGGSVRWRLLLHGYFFPDSGRRGVLGLEDAATDQEPTHEQGVRQQWNAWIRTLVTLPCLLPAVAEALKACPPQDGEALCAALTRTALWSHHRALIAGEIALVWGPISRATASRQVPRTSRSLALPRVPPHADSSVGRVLDSLLRVETARAVVVGWVDGPRLADSDRWDPWSDEDLAMALGVGLEEALIDEAAVRYLTDCLRLIGTGAAARGGLVIDLLRRCVSRDPRGLMRDAVREAWQALVENAPPSRILWLRGAPDLVREAGAVSQHVLVLPMDVRPIGWEVPRRLDITESDVVRLLEFLAPRIASGARNEPAERLAAEVVAGYGPKRVREDERLRDLPVFRVWSARSRGYVCLSATALIQLSERRLVFRKGGMPRPEDVVGGLREALRDEGLDVILADDDVAEPLGFVDLSLGTIAELIGGGDLAIALEPARRRRALRQLLADRAGHGTEPLEAGRERTRRALRVLLHGEQRRFQDTGALYVFERKGDDPLAGVARKLLVRLDIDWRLLPETLVADLSLAHLQELGVERIDARWLFSLLRVHPHDTAEGLVADLDEVERAWLRLAIVAEREEMLWRTLPIHPIQRGGNARLDGRRIYRLTAAWAVPPRLADDVDLVSPDRRPEVEAWLRQTVLDWSPSAQIEACLRRQDRSCTLEILGALEALRREGVSPSINWDPLRRARWVPTAARSHVAPADVLELPESIQVAARDLLGAGEQVFVVPGELADEVCSHPAFTFLIERFALRGDGALAALALQIQERQARDRACGLPVWPRGKGLSVDRVLELGTASSVLREDRSWALLRAVRLAYPESWLAVGRDLVEALTGDLDASRLVALLDLLSRDPRLADNEDDVVLFDHYLRLAVAQPDFAGTVLPRVRLLSGARTWRSAGELARWGSNLLATYQVHPRHAEILRLSTDGAGAPVSAGGPTSVPRSAPTNGDLTRAAKMFDAYLTPWRGRVGDEALGLFVCLFGAGLDEQIFKLAERYLVSRADDALDNILLKYTERGVAGQLALERKTAFAAKYVFHPVAAGEILEVESLTGTMFQAAVDENEADTVFVGRVPAASQGGWIRLRQIDPAARTPEQLHQILRQSIEQFLLQALGLYMARSAFDEHWSRFVVAERAHVEVVRQLLLDSLPLSIAQLALRQDPLLREPLTRIERAQMHDHEVRSGGRWNELVQEAAKELGAARADLLRRIEQDAAVQSSLLRAIRKKLAGFQYQPSQVLFELFQNADDAAAQLAEMLAHAGPLDEDVRTGVERSRRFRVEAKVGGWGTLRVTHWGRGINQHHVGGAFRAGRERGYDLDLRNMLALHYSEKDEGATGRFGLGFKSVFLLTDAPRVTSRDLSFAVVAGILPVHRPVERAARAAGVVGSPTTFELPLRAEGDEARACERFGRIGGLLPVFARTIRHVELVSRETTVTSEWTPIRVPGVPEAETGSVRMDLRRLDALCRLLVVRSEGPGPRPAIAFALNGGGLADVPDHVPTIWCTTPTLEEWRVGFCMNGPFAVDVGRGQLARKADENHRVLADLGQMLGCALRALFVQLDADLPGTAAALGLVVTNRTPDQVRQSFWAGMFDRLTRGFSPAAPLEVREYFAELHRPGRGLAALLDVHAALPTGLPAAHETLTSRDRVRWVVDDYLSRPEVFGEVQRWPRVAARMMPGSAVADRIQQHLRAFGCALKVDHVGLETAVRWAIPDGLVQNVDDASTIAALDRLLERDGVTDVTRYALAAWKKELRFRSAKGDWQEARLLHLSEAFREVIEGLEADRRADLQDELLRSHFVPPERVLSPVYAGSSEALRFVLFVRSRLHSEAPILADWACHAKTLAAQQGVLHYLARGRLAREMAQGIVATGGLPWCQDPVTLRALAAAAALDDVAPLLLAALFPTHHSWPDWWEALITGDRGEGDAATTNYGDEGDEAGSVAGLVPSPADAGEVLRKIAEWWRARGAEWSRRYEQRVYPADLQPIVLARALRGEDGAEPARNAWLLLLTLGACQRFGRQTPVQHRGFVDRLRQSGSPRWWDVIVRGQARPEEWTTILDQWMGEQVQDETYGQWLGLYPTLYQFHRFGDVYRQLFLGAPLRRAQFDLAQLLTPRADSSLHGAGSALDAPPVRRALGLGGVWMLRELVRFGVIAGPHLEPFCFVPRGRTRELFMRLGIGQALHELELPACSLAIHAFLGRHLDPADVRFAGAFDLPIQLVIEDADARSECGVEDLLR